MNNWIGLGRLTRDVDVRATGSGKTVGRFTLAINRPVAADKAKATDFINCTAFGKTAETISKYVSKGQRLLVRGSVHTSTYADKNGEKRYGTEIWVESFDFIEKSDSAASSSFAVDDIVASM